MSQSIRCTLGYALRQGETLESAAKRLGADVGTGRALTKGIVELPVTIELGQAESAKAEALLQADVVRRFSTARVTETQSNQVRSFRVEDADETFDVTVRSNRVYITTFDGFGGVDDISDTAVTALGRAYEAYRAVIAARAL